MSVKPEGPYIKIYSKGLECIGNLPGRCDVLTISLLYHASDASDSDGGMCVALAPIVKRRICKEIGWKRISSVNTALTKLVANNVLRRLGTSFYQINPYMFGKGKWEDIARLRQEYANNES